MIGNAIRSAAAALIVLLGVIACPREAEAQIYCPQNTFGTDGSKPTAGQWWVCLNFLQSSVQSTNPLTALPTGDIFIGNISGKPAAQAVSGDATLSAVGALTVTKTNGVPFTAAATTPLGTSGASLCLLSANCTFSGTDNFTGTFEIGGVAVALPISAANGGSGEAGTVTGALNGNGTSAYTHAACADLSNGASGCSTTVGPLATASPDGISVRGNSSILSISTPLYAQNYSGSDYGAKTNTALVSCSSGIPCPIYGPVGNSPLNFSTTIALSTDQSLDCPPGGNQSQNTLSYTGSSAAVSVTGKGGSVFGCNMTLGTSAADGILLGAGSQGNIAIDRTFLDGGGSGTNFYDLNNISNGRVTNSSNYRTTAGSNSFFLTNVNDIILSNDLVYGAGFNGTADTTSNTVVLDSAAYGVVIDGILGGWSGAHGLLVQDKFNTGLHKPPAQMTITRFIADCTKGGSTALFDATLGSAAMTALLADSWFAGAGQDCAAPGTIVLSNAHGVEIEAGGGLMATGLRVRANSGAGYYNNSTQPANFLVASEATANNIYAVSTTWSGIEETANATGFGVFDNFTGNNADQSGGQQKYGVNIGSTSGYGSVSNNICGVNATGCINEGDAGKVSYWNNVSPLGSADPLNRVFGDVQVASDTARTTGAHVIPSYSSSDSYLSGIASNLYFDPASGNFKTTTDGGSNGGFAILASVNPTGSTTPGVFLFPSTGGGSGQSIAPGSLGTYQLVNFSGGAWNFTKKITGSFNGVTGDWGDGTNATVYSRWGNRSSFGWNTTTGSTEILSPSGSEISFQLGGTFGTATGFLGIFDSSGNFCVGVNSSCGSDGFSVSSSGVVTSRVTTGTAPFVVASTTNIPNLNASSLNGATFASPGAIGGTTPASGSFTTLSSTTATNTQMAATSTGTNQATVVVNNSAGSQGSVILLQDAGVNKWFVGNTTGNLFSIFDYVNSTNILGATTTGNVTLGETGKSTTIQGSTTLSGSSVTVSSLTASLPVFTDASKILTNTAPAGYSAVLSGTSASLGGGALLAGACTSGTVSVTGATSSMAVVVTPTGYPGDAIYWRGYVSSSNTITVDVCAVIAATPTAETYNVRVLQ